MAADSNPRHSDHESYGIWTCYPTITSSTVHHSVLIIHVGLWKHVQLMVKWIRYKPTSDELKGAAVAEWLRSWLAEQEVRGSIPGLATWIFSCVQVAIWLKYRWSDVNPQYNQPTIRWTKTNDSNWKNVVLHNHLPVRYSNLNIFILAKYTMICQRSLSKPPRQISFRRAINGRPDVAGFYNTDIERT